VTFIETYLAPFFISLLANETPNISTKLKSIGSIEDVKLKKLFTKTMINTLKTHKKCIITGLTNLEIKGLLKAIKNDDSLLYILIKKFSDNGKKNFFNALQNREREFFIELFKIYNIDAIKIEINDTYNNLISNFLEIYKVEFIKNLDEKESLKLIFKEVIKLDGIEENILDIKKSLNNKNQNQNQNHMSVNLFKLIKFDYLETDYANALSCSGLGENDVKVCPFNESYLEEIIMKIELANKFVIKGDTGSGKSLLTYQVANSYHNKGWQVYKLYKDSIIENKIFTYPSEKTLIIVDDAQILNQGLFDFIADHANKNCLILFNWNMSTSAVNDEFLYSYQNLEIDNLKQVTLMKEFSLDNKDVITQKLNNLNINVNPLDSFDNIERRIEKASYQKTPWEFNFVLTEGWDSVSNDMEVLKSKKRLDLGLVVIAFFQFITLDNGITKEILINELKGYTNDDVWLDNFNKILNNKNFCAENDDLIKLKHYQYAKEVLYYFISNNKDEEINEFIEQFIKNLLMNPKYEVGYSNLLEFIWFNYRTLRFELNRQNFSLKMIDILFNKSSGTNEVKIKNLNSLVRFSEQNHEVIAKQIYRVYKWIKNANRKIASPLEKLVNELYNEKFNLCITKEMMDSILDKIVTSKLIEKSMYSGLYNRLNMFAKLQSISNNPLNMSLSNVSLGVEHYHFSKVISDLGGIDVNWTNECIKDNIDFMAQILNNNLLEAIRYYRDIFSNNFGLNHRILGISNKSNKYAKKLASLIEVNKVLEAFSKLSLNNTQNFSHFLLFLKIYNRDKLDEISFKVNYDYLKILFPNDFLDVHEHKAIIYLLYNKNSAKYNEYVNYLIENCVVLSQKLLSLNPELSLKQLKNGKNYKMYFHGNEDYSFTMMIIKWLDEEKEHNIVLDIINFNEKIIQNCILNNICNSKNKYDFLIYIYENSPLLYKNILSDKEKVNKHIQKLYNLLRGKSKEKMLAKLYFYLIGEFTNEHKQELAKLKKKFPSLKNLNLIITG